MRLCIIFHEVHTVFREEESSLLTCITMALSYLTKNIYCIYYSRANSTTTFDLCDRGYMAHSTLPRLLAEFRWTTSLRRTLLSIFFLSSPLLSSPFFFSGSIGDSLGVWCNGYWYRN